MQHKFLLLLVLILFSNFIMNLIKFMIRDKKAIIRFIGYILAILMAVFVLYIILYCYFDIKLLEVFL